MIPALSIHNCDFIPYLQQKVKVFKAGQIAYYILAWKELTSDKTVLKIVEGDYIESIKKSLFKIDTHIIPSLKISFHYLNKNYSHCSISKY